MPPPDSPASHPKQRSPKWFVALVFLLSALRVPSLAPLPNGKLTFELLRRPQDDTPVMVGKGVKSRLVSRNHTTGGRG